MDRKPPAIHRSQLGKKSATNHIYLPLDNDCKDLSVRQLVEKGCKIVIDDDKNSASPNKTTTSAVRSSLPTKDEMKPGEKKTKT